MIEWAPKSWQAFGNVLVPFTSHALGASSSPYASPSTEGALQSTGRPASQCRRSMRFSLLRKPHRHHSRQDSLLRCLSPSPSCSPCPPQTARLQLVRSLRCPAALQPPPTTPSRLCPSPSPSWPPCPPRTARLHLVPSLPHATVLQQPPTTPSLLHTRSPAVRPPHRVLVSRRRWCSPHLPPRVASLLSLPLCCRWAVTRPLRSFSTTTKTKTATSDCRTRTCSGQRAAHLHPALQQSLSHHACRPTPCGRTRMVSAPQAPAMPSSSFRTLPASCLSKCRRRLPHPLHLLQSLPPPPQRRRPSSLLQPCRCSSKHQRRTRPSWYDSTTPGSRTFLVLTSSSPMMACWPRLRAMALVR
jgi:hypothetical protein